MLRKALQDESIDEPDTGIRLESMVSVGEITVNLLFKFVRTIQVKLKCTYMPLPLSHKTLSHLQSLVFDFVSSTQLYALHLVHETVRIWKDMGTQWQTAGQHQIVEVSVLLCVRVYLFFDHVRIMEGNGQ